ncbi:hypothetical protein [Ulvibacterium sp.]|uniref:hypothetical protein n=1 Tax=Ulvibacterium sp. TaxID=2665914 RepID=UPI003BA91C1A
MDVIRNIKEVFNQVFVTKKLLGSIFFGVVPALIFYIISLIGLNSVGFGIMEILRDPAQQSGTSSFLGFMSNIGIWLWISSAAICFFFVFAPRKVVRKNFRELFFLTGMLSILLAIDDFFMIHDRYVNQKICYLAYAIFAVTLFIRHYKTIIRLEGFAFLLAGAFLALSIFTDLIQSRVPLSYEYVQVIEEGFKFTGAATWLYFNTRVPYSLLNTNCQS